VVGGRIAAVRTPETTIATRVLVNAAGGWAGAVGELAGVGPRTLQPRRRHMFKIRSNQAIDPALPFVWHREVDVYLRPDAGELMTSPCDATPHSAAPPEVDPGAQLALFAKLRRAFPAVADAEVTSTWACLRTFTGDERFAIGADPEIEGLIWVAGLGGHGMTTSPAVGRLAADAVLGVRSAQLAVFDPARLAGGSAAMLNVKC
jgi:glycine/D-amino acid oxidase-like deaminating enzyme